MGHYVSKWPGQDLFSILKPNNGWKKEENRRWPAWEGHHADEDPPSRTNDYEPLLQLPLMK